MKAERVTTGPYKNLWFYLKSNGKLLKSLSRGWYVILIPPLPTPQKKKKNLSTILEMDETGQEWRQDVN